MGPPSAQTYAKNAAATTAAAGATSQGQSSQLFNISLPGYQSALQYFQKLSSGNPAAVNTAVEPQVNQINQQYDAATQAAARNTARGGAQADEQTALQLQRTGQIAGAKSAAVASAPTTLASTAEAGQQLSQNALTNALNAFATSGNIDLNLLGPEQQETQNDINDAVALAGLL